MAPLVSWLDKHKRELRWGKRSGNKNLLSANVLNSPVKTHPETNNFFAATVPHVPDTDSFG
jgi:hypothetical protein